MNPTQSPPPDESRPPPEAQRPRAQHGFRNEVSWDGGTAAQPYGNQGEEEAPSPAAGHEVPEGSRGEHSGQALEQFERARGTP